jgi:hypothetical protein
MTHREQLDADFKQFQELHEQAVTQLRQWTERRVKIEGALEYAAASLKRLEDAAQSTAPDAVEQEA